MSANNYTDSYITISFYSNDPQVTWQGPTAIKAKTGKTFASLITPVPTKPDWIFNKWIYMETGKDVLPTDLITTDTIVSPIFIQDDIYHIITFSQAEADIIQGPTQVQIGQRQYFQEVVHPLVKKANYEFKYWMTLSGQEITSVSQFTQDETLIPHFELITDLKSASYFVSESFIPYNPTSTDYTSPQMIPFAKKSSYQIDLQQQTIASENYVLTITMLDRKETYSNLNSGSRYWMGRRYTDLHQYSLPIVEIFNTKYHTNYTTFSSLSVDNLFYWVSTPDIDNGYGGVDCHGAGSGTNIFTWVRNTESQSTPYYGSSTIYQFIVQLS